ncbi:unnamed protein product [Pleuronectes platessa]|uniref:Uncharacterized protein n=1 Tax=Pleuronectes platessa TaxID=8262 RepID=A0A9N7YA66_PLEPL|nr:unnamed protein product [Pleuronectes platessa]
MKPVKHVVVTLVSQQQQKQQQQGLESVARPDVPPAASQPPRLCPLEEGNGKVARHSERQTGDNKLIPEVGRRSGSNIAGSITAARIRSSFQRLKLWNQVQLS